MKMHFILVVSGEKSLKDKLDDAIRTNSDLHKEMIQDFYLSVVKRLKITEEDNLTIEKFRACLS